MVCNDNKLILGLKATCKNLWKLFYLLLALILWYPRPPNSMLCRSYSLCCLRNRQISIVWGGRGGMFPRRSKIELHCKVSQHFCCPLCSSRKYPYSPHRRNWNFLGGGGSGRPKNLKKCMKLNWNFQRDGEVLEKIPSVGEVWIFSGTTHCSSIILKIL